MRNVLRVQSLKRNVVVVVAGKTVVAYLHNIYSTTTARKLCPRCAPLLCSSILGAEFWNRKWIGRRLEISFVDYWLESVRKIINTRFILKSIFLTNILKLFVNYFFKIYRFLFTRCMYMFRIYKASKWIWTSLKFYWIILLYIFIFPSVGQESIRRIYEFSWIVWN